MITLDFLCFLTGYNVSILPSTTSPSRTASPRSRAKINPQWFSSCIFTIVMRKLVANQERLSPVQELLILYP